MLGIFNLNQTLASNSSADPDDTLNTKRALGSLGYYATPSYGMTKYPDEGLFDGIMTFQKDNGLANDGVMKPAGETATQLGKTLAERRTTKNPLRAVKADTEEQQATPWPEPFPKKPKAQAPTSTPSTPLIKPTPPIPLQKAVGRKQPNRAGDVGTAIGQLIGKGIYGLRNRQQDAVVKNTGLEDAIMAFQKSSGLNVDAVMKPGGETEKALLKVPGDQHPPSAPETPTDPGQDDPDEPNDIKPKPPGDQHPPEEIKPKPPGDQHPPEKPDCRQFEQKLEKLKTDLDEAQNNKQNKRAEIEEIEAEIMRVQQEIEHLKVLKDDEEDKSGASSPKRLSKNQIILFLQIIFRVLEPGPANRGENTFLIAQKEEALEGLKENLFSLGSELKDIEVRIVEIGVKIQKAEADLKTCMSGNQ